MANLLKSRLPNQFPADEGLSPQARQCLDQMLLAINTLIGQGSVPPASGIQAFGPELIDPTTSQLLTGGSRTTSLATGIVGILAPTTATFYWDGSNGSQAFKIYRDDGSVFGPFITGSPFLVSGLVASTKYFFYPYFDESLEEIQFSSIAGVSTGSPAVAFTAQNNLAAQQQFLRNRIPLGLLLVTQGVTTPATGTTTVNGGSGGGGAGGGGAGNILK